MRACLLGALRLRSNRPELLVFTLMYAVEPSKACPLRWLLHPTATMRRSLKTASLPHLIAYTRIMGKVRPTR